MLVKVPLHLWDLPLKINIYLNTFEKILKKIMKRRPSLRCFQRQDRVLSRLRHLTEKMTEITSPTRVPVVLTTHCPPQLQISIKCNISHWVYWLVSLTSQVFIFCQIMHLEQAFCYIFFTDSRFLRSLPLQR